MLPKIMAVVLAIGLAASPVAAGKGGGKGHGHGKKEQKVGKGRGDGHGHARKAAKQRKGGRGHRSDVVVVSRPRSRGPARAARVAVVGSAAPRVVARRQPVVFRDSDRGIVRNYFVDRYGRGNCPPGLAKKNNGCLPPGQAKKRYVVGRRLADTVVVEPLPSVLITRLAPVPVGYQYVVVDNDILLLGLATRLVADAIDWID